MSLSTTKRPGPLREWPLDSFLPANPNIFPSKAGSSRPNKRTLSPDGPSLFSPAKRRILTQEGIFSPEKTIKSPFRGRITSSAYFGDLLGPDSPAKKLDFGAPKPSTDLLSLARRDSTSPATASSSRSPACTPESRSKTVAKSTPSRGLDPLDDFFASPERLPSSRPSTTLQFIPREPPVFSDPQSIHYPGFAVHRDAHAVVVHAVDLETMTEEKEEHKENIAPRRRMKKSVTEPASSDMKSLLLTPAAKKRELEKLLKAKSTPATPRKVATKERQDVTSPTPRRPGLRSSSKAGTPAVTEDERKQRRRIMKNEVEAASGIDNDEHL